MGATMLQPLAAVERRHILAVFEACGRNKQRAAAALGVSLKTLYTRLHLYGCETKKTVAESQPETHGERAVKHPDVLTTGAAAKICKVSPRTVTKWFDAGRLKGYRIPGSSDRRIPAASLVAFLREHGMPVPATLNKLRLAYGVLASEVPAGWTHCESVFDLAIAIAEPDTVTAVVIGDTDGVAAAVRIARQLLARHPDAAVTLLVDASVGVVEGWAGRVVVRPADAAAVYGGAA